MRNLTGLAGGKYLVRNFYAKVAQLVIDPTSKEFNHFLALSFREKRNNLSLMASSRTPLTLNISQISIKKISCVNWDPRWAEFWIIYT